MFEPNTPDIALDALIGFIRHSVRHAEQLNPRIAEIKAEIRRHGKAYDNALSDDARQAALDEQNRACHSLVLECARNAPLH